MSLIFKNIWASITKASQQLITDITTAGLASPQFIDWDAHANIQELPDVDLVGPTGIGMMEDNQQIAVNFAIGVSSYGDVNLFRMREMTALIFEAMRPTKQFIYYNAITALPAGYLLITDGTTLPPMSRSEIRPWQFVQASALLEPLAAI